MGSRNTVEILLSASDRASGTIRSTFGTLESASSKVMGALKQSAIVAGAAMATLGGYVAKTGISYDAMAEQSQVAWNTLLGTQDKAKKMLQDIAVFAKNTQFDNPSVDTMAKYMYNAGLQGKALFNELTQVADVAGAFNIPAESAKELTRQMSQVRQAGVAYTEDLNVLQDRGVPIFQALADVMGVNVASVKKMASEGKVTADVYNKAFDSVADKVKGSSEAQSKTFSGMISTLKDNFDMISGELSKPLFEKLKQGLTTLMPVLDGTLSLVKGDFKTFSDTMNQTFGSETGSKITGFANILGKGFQLVSEYVNKGKMALKALFDFISGDNIGAINILTKMGLSPDMVVGITQTVVSIKDTISGFINGIIAYGKSLFSGEGNLGQSFISIFNTIKSVALPIFQDIVAFIGDKIAMIKQFWEENGAQITQAVQKMWAGIAAVFQFIAPVLLFIVGMVWDTIKGVINGAINVILGVIKIFAGLFTGDFGKMWEGIKQLFVGAVEFLWNWINLMMFGRILSGIKGFVNGGKEWFKGFWDETVKIFKGMGDGVWSTVSGMFTKVKSVFQGILDSSRSIFGAVRDAITSPMETAKMLVGKAIDAIKSFFTNLGTKIPLPHLKVDWDSINVLGKKISYPVGADVKWYDSPRIKSTEATKKNAKFAAKLVQYFSSNERLILV